MNIFERIGVYALKHFWIYLLIVIAISLTIVGIIPIAFPLIFIWIRYLFINRIYRLKWSVDETIRWYIYKIERAYNKIYYKGITGAMYKMTYKYNNMYLRKLSEKVFYMDRMLYRLSMFMKVVEYRREYGYLYNEFTPNDKSIPKSLLNDIRELYKNVDHSYVLYNKHLRDIKKWFGANYTFPIEDLFKALNSSDKAIRTFITKYKR